MSESWEFQILRQDNCWRICIQSKGPKRKLVEFYVKSNGNRCCTSPTWAEVQFRSSWSTTRRSRVGLQLGRDGLDWSCTRWTSVDSTQGHWVQVQVQRGAAELNLDLDEVALSWSCTRSSTSTLRPSPSRPSWSSTRRSRVELQLGRDGLGLNVLVLLRVQLQCNVDKLGGPPYESTLQSSQRWSIACSAGTFVIYKVYVFCCSEPE